MILSPLTLMLDRSCGWLNPSMQFKAKRQALKVSLIYVIAAGVWVLFSDELVKFLTRNPDERVELSIFKGWVFVVFTGGWLYVILQRSFRQWEREWEQRKRATDQLRVNEEHLRLVLEATTDGSWDLDLKTGIVHLSPRYSNMTGYPAGKVEANVEFFKKLVHPEDWPAVLAAMNGHLAGKSAQSVVEYRMITKAGAIKWIWGRGKVVERALDGSPLRMVGTISDITEHHKAKAALRKSEEKYRALFESSRDAIMITEPDTLRFLSGNPAALKMFGAKNEAEFLSLSPMFLSPERQPDGRASGEKAREMIETVLREGSHFFEWMHRRTNGDEFFADVVLTRMEENERTSILGTVRDITERKLAERRMVDAINYSQTLLAASPIGIITYEAAGQTVSANEAAARLVGTTVENVKKQNFRELDSWKKSNFLQLADLALETRQEQAFVNHTMSSFGLRLCLM